MCFLKPERCTFVSSVLSNFACLAEIVWTRDKKANKCQEGPCFWLWQKCVTSKPTRSTSLVSRATRPAYRLRRLARESHAVTQDTATYHDLGDVIDGGHDLWESGDSRQPAGSEIRPLAWGQIQCDPALVNFHVHLPMSTGLYFLSFHKKSI